MDADQVATLRTVLASTGWLERTGVFGRALRTSTRTRGGLLVVGTPTEEPWHVTAHLDEESRLSAIPELMPTLVRWAPPADAPPHLSVGLSRLEEARRGETLFVVAEDAAPVPLLERVNDARHVGATILALDGGDPELDGLAHESLSLPATGEDELVCRFVNFDAAQHLVSAAAGSRDSDFSSRGKPGRGVRARLARLLDTVAGPSTATPSWYSSVSKAMAAWVEGCGSWCRQIICTAIGGASRSGRKTTPSRRYWAVVPSGVMPMPPPAAMIASQSSMSWVSWMRGRLVPGHRSRVVVPVRGSISSVRCGTSSSLMERRLAHGSSAARAQ
jgi:hypothetical protein